MSEFRTGVSVCFLDPIDELIFVYNNSINYFCKSSAFIGCVCLREQFMKRRLTPGVRVKALVGCVRSSSTSQCRAQSAANELREAVSFAASPSGCHKDWSVQLPVNGECMHVEVMHDAADKKHKGNLGRGAFPRFQHCQILGRIL